MAILGKPYIRKPDSWVRPQRGHPRLRGCFALFPLNEGNGRPYNNCEEAYKGGGNTNRELQWDGGGEPTDRRFSGNLYNDGSGDTYSFYDSDDTAHPLHFQAGDQFTLIYRFKLDNTTADYYTFGAMGGQWQWGVGVSSANRPHFRQPAYTSAGGGFLYTDGAWETHAWSVDFNGSNATRLWVLQEDGDLLFTTLGTGGSPADRKVNLTVMGAKTGNDAPMELEWFRIYTELVPDNMVRSIMKDPWAEWRKPLPIWIQTAAGAVTKTLQADLDLLAKEQNILKTATLDLISKKLDNLRQADMDIRVLKVNELLADMDLLAKKLDNLKTADMDLLAKTLNNLKQADLDFIVNATKFLEVDQDFLAKKLNNLKQADMDLLAKKLDNLEQADLDFLAKQIDILNNVDLDMVVKTLNNLRNADLDLLAKKLDNLKLADLDFIVSAANTITLEADLDFLSKVLDNLKTADLDFLAKTVDNLKTADLDFIAKTIDNLKLADLDFLAKALDNVNTADLDFLAKTLNNLELVDLDFIVKKTTILEATLDIIVTAGTVLKTATLDLLAKKLDNVKQVDLDFVVFQELVLALCSRVTQIAALLAGNVSADNIFSGTMTFGNTLSGGAIADGLLSGETSGGLLTATIDVDTVCN